MYLGLEDKIAMTQDEEKQLLKEVHENNIMLRSIISYINAREPTKDIKAFSLNLLADIVGNNLK